jgi:pimeloyl-ACP methyl ester carboxylesterase
MVFWLVLIAVILVLVAPFLWDWSRPAPDIRNAPGELVALGHGATHYRWFGPSKGPVVVAVHGLTTPMQAWQSVAEALAEEGYRVLCYDLYGRGFSDPPREAQTRAHFLGQLTDLLADQGIKESFVLMGFSMGGAIAVDFAAAQPERVARLVLVAPAGIAETGWDVHPQTGWRWLWELWVSYGPKRWRFRRDLKKAKGQPSEVRGIVAIQLWQLEQAGFWAAVRSSGAVYLPGMRQEEHRKIRTEEIPTLAIWGETDDVIPIAAMGTLAQWNPTAEHEVIAGADHGVAYTHGRQIAALVLASMGAR